VVAENGALGVRRCGDAAVVRSPSRSDSAMPSSKEKCTRMSYILYNICVGRRQLKMLPWKDSPNVPSLQVRRPPI